jgi:hypothetical protein
MDGAIDLKDVFQRGMQLFLDPNCPSPLRRELNALMVQSADGIARKCAEYKQDDLRPEVQAESFWGRSGHVYKPNYSPSRHQSAAQRARGEAETSAPRPVARSVPLEIRLGYGLGDDLPISDLQKALNDRRKGHSFAERSKQWINKQNNASSNVPDRSM